MISGRAALRSRVAAEAAPATMIRRARRLSRVILLVMRSASLVPAAATSRGRQVKARVDGRYTFGHTCRGAARASFKSGRAVARRRGPGQRLARCDIQVTRRVTPFTWRRELHFRRSARAASMRQPAAAQKRRRGHVGQAQRAPARRQEARAAARPDTAEAAKAGERGQRAISTAACRVAELRARRLPSPKYELDGGQAAGIAAATAPPPQRARLAAEQRSPRAMALLGADGRSAFDSAAFTPHFGGGFPRRDGRARRHAARAISPSLSLLIIDVSQKDASSLRHRKVSGRL